MQGASDRRPAADPRFGSPHVLLLLGTTALALFLMPAVLAAYPLLILCNMLVLSIACLGLNVLYGTTGSLSLGHATYFGAAAYSGAFLYRFSAVDSFELYLLFGALASTLFAAAIGFVCVRTGKIFFTILTLALSMVAYSVVVDGAVFRLFGRLGWSLYLLGGGAMYVPRLTILGLKFGPLEFIPVLYGVIVAAFLVSVFACWRIRASPFGLALNAIRDSELRAAFVGIPVWQYRWYAFIMSGILVGIAGGLYGQLERQITPDQLHWLFSAQLVLATVLGGKRHLLGPVLGAFAFVGLDELALHLPVGRNMIFGVLLIIVVLAFPQGIAGGFIAVRDRVRSYRP